MALGCSPPSFTTSEQGVHRWRRCTTRRIRARSLRDALAAAGWTVTEAAGEAGLHAADVLAAAERSDRHLAGMALALERIGWSNAAFWVRRKALYDLAQERIRTPHGHHRGRQAHRPRRPRGATRRAAHPRQALEGFVRAEAADAPTRRGLGPGPDSRRVQRHPGDLHEAAKDQSRSRGAGPSGRTGTVAITIHVDPGDPDAVEDAGRPSGERRSTA